MPEEIELVPLGAKDAGDACGYCALAACMLPLIIIILLCFIFAYFGAIQLWWYEVWNGLWMNILLK